MKAIIFILSCAGAAVLVAFASGFHWGTPEFGVCLGSGIIFGAALAPLVGDDR